MMVLLSAYFWAYLIIEQTVLVWITYAALRRHEAAFTSVCFTIAGLITGLIVGNLIIFRWSFRYYQSHRSAELRTNSSSTPAITDTIVTVSVPVIFGLVAIVAWSGVVGSHPDFGPAGRALFRIMAFSVFGCFYLVEHIVISLILTGTWYLLNRRNIHVE